MQQQKNNIGRNPKANLDFFYIDKDWIEDPRILKLTLRHKANGIAVYFETLTKIYTLKDGYYYNNNDFFECTLAMKLSLEQKQIKNIIKYCCTVGLFDKELFRKHKVLTSKSIQAKWAVAMNKLNRVNQIPTTFSLFEDENELFKYMGKHDKEMYNDDSNPYLPQNNQTVEQQKQEEDKKVCEIIKNFEHISAKATVSKEIRDIVETFQTQWQTTMICWQQYKAIQLPSKLQGEYTQLRDKSNGNIKMAKWLVAYAIYRNWKGYRVAEESHYNPEYDTGELMSESPPPERPPAPPPSEPPPAKPPEKPEKIPEKKEFVEYGLQVLRTQNLQAESYLFSLENKYDAWKNNHWKDGNNKKITNWKLKLNSTIPYLKPLKTGNYGNNTTNIQNSAESRERDYRQRFAERTMQEFAEQITEQTGN